MSLRASLLVLGLLLLSACPSDEIEPTNNNTGSTEISASAYNQSCEVDEDCVAVNEGEVCTGCNCPNAAIHKDDKGAWDAARQASVDRCSEPNPDAPLCDCQIVPAICSQGTCETMP